ncbi:MAG: hypothetical protein ABI045_03595 [Flavobacteriales bacterium]
MEYQFGKKGYSRLERGFTRKKVNEDFIPVIDPMPNYYKNLPSNFKTPTKIASISERFFTDNIAIVISTGQCSMSKTWTISRQSETTMVRDEASQGM